MNLSRISHFKVPTSSKFGLSFLLGPGPGTATLQYPFQRKVSNEELSTVHAGVNILPSPQVEAPSSTLQDSSTPSPHFFLDPVLDSNSQPRRANATLIILARNSDLEGVIQSMEQVESRFNRKFNYPWVLLNDEEFSAEFKRWVGGWTARCGVLTLHCFQTCQRID